MTAGVRARSVIAAVVLAWCACAPAVDVVDAGQTVDRVGDCGLTGSAGNALGVGRYCERDAECTAVPSPLQLHCSTVLVDSVLPLLCSASCEPGATDCGAGSSCRDISSIGYDLIVCVPDACERDFPSIFAPPPDAGIPDAGELVDAGNDDAGSLTDGGVDGGGG